MLNFLLLLLSQITITSSWFSNYTADSANVLSSMMTWSSSAFTLISSFAWFIIWLYVINKIFSLFKHN